MSTNIIQLLQFKFQGHLQKQTRDLECSCIRAHFEEKSIKFVDVTVAILLFYHQNTLTNLFILAQFAQNLELVNLKYVTYVQPI